jgi:hypothetical protein
METEPDAEIKTILEKDESGLMNYHIPVPCTEPDEVHMNKFRPLIESSF